MKHKKWNTNLELNKYSEGVMSNVYNIGLYRIRTYMNTTEYKMRDARDKDNKWIKKRLMKYNVTDI